MRYLKRIADGQLSLKLDAFGGALIIGPKGCGKTTTAKQKAKSVVEFQDEDERENYLLIANTHPSDLLKGAKPRLFDEWQDAPQIWGAIRKDIDDTGNVGLYILTGSSSADVPTPHTGTHELSRRPGMDLSNVYFVIGTSYAGKSTIVKNLAKKHQGIALEENYHDAKLPELDSNEFPGLTYTRDLQDWHEFIRRTPDEYVTWLRNTAKECEIVELQILEELLEKPEAKGKKIFVDTNICIETLHRISDTRHVLVMLADPEIGIHRFFDRPDPEKQFLYQLMLEEPDPQAALDNYREILTQVCSKESYDELLYSGFEVIFRDENRSQEETVLLAEKIFGIS